MSKSKHEMLIEAMACEALQERQEVIKALTSYSQMGIIKPIDTLCEIVVKLSKAKTAKDIIDEANARLDRKEKK